MYGYKSYTKQSIELRCENLNRSLIENGGRTREYSNWKTADIVWPRGISETSRLANLNRLADIHPSSFQPSLVAVTTKAMRNISHAENGMRVSISKVAPLESIRTCGCTSVINSWRYSLRVTCIQFNLYISKLKIVNFTILLILFKYAKHCTILMYYTTLLCIHTYVHNFWTIPRNHHMSVCY